ncbi:MAG TPA: glycine--tRNA ligase subunit beta, partial [Candidatus Polarisedimenticolaceae bacterium]|nr:glycine--tRNA ligase subunit beta [Candidatus Polarisedimenticolaceae bacterium]
MSSAPLLLELGCEEIPARMIATAATDLAARVVAILDRAKLPHGPVQAWGGTRRLSVHVAEVAARVADERKLLLGPPAAAAFGADGTPTPAAIGFARKQGIDPATLGRVETDKGSYAGVERVVLGRSLGELLAEGLPAAVAAMSFPKTMRWGTGAHRWVRPLHWLAALHGGEPLPLELFGVRAGRVSNGHRFLAPGPVDVAHADGYAAALRAAYVVIDPAERRRLLEERLAQAAARVGGALVPDAELLDEVADLVEWPGVVVGRFDPDFLDLPREILVTTLRHHQKSFCVQTSSGLSNSFLAVANTDRDPAGHVQRGNEWVVSGRLADARFFWDEDRKRPLADRLEELAKVAFHARLGSYREKAQRIERRAAELAERLSAADRDA